MKTRVLATLAVAAAVGLLASCGPKPDQAATEQAEAEPLDAAAARLARDTIIVDTHIDVPYRLQERYEDVGKATESGDFDYPRAQTGGLNAPFMSIYIPAELEASGGARALADKLIDMVEKITTDHGDEFALAPSVAAVRENFAGGLISLPMGMENGAPIEGSLDNLRHFYDRGVRYITLTHSLSNHISDSSYDTNRQWHGLSEFGKKLVVEMNNLGVMVDVSHISDIAFYQVIEISRAPVIASHSSARKFTPGWERNMSDDMIARLAAAGGVIQVALGSPFISNVSRQAGQAQRDAGAAHFEELVIEPTPEQSHAFDVEYRAAHPYPYATLDDVLDVFDHVIEVAGIDHVGIGSDYDGVGDSLPEGLKDVASYPTLIRGLLVHGHSEADVQKILSGNLLRVWSEVEAYAADH